jgi:cytochrome c556
VTGKRKKKIKLKRASRSYKDSFKFKKKKKKAKHAANRLYNNTKKEQDKIFSAFDNYEKKFNRRFRRKSTIKFTVN